MAPSDTISGASTEGTSKERETHDWTPQESDYLLQQIKEKVSIFQACKTNFGKKVSRDMNTRFKPKVEFTKDRIRSRLSVVRKKWDHKRKGLQVSRSVSQSIPVSLLEKHSQTIAEELARC